MPQPNKVIISHDKAKEDREYFVQLSDSGYVEQVHLKIQKEKAPDNLPYLPYPFIDSLVDTIKDVLKLKNRESMYFNPDKGDPTAKAILTRTR